MDPDANLQEQELMLKYPAQLKENTYDLARLVELRQALGDWLRGGGFQPDWSKAPIAARFYGK